MFDLLLHSPPHPPSPSRDRSGAATATAFLLDADRLQVLEAGGATRGAREGEGGTPGMPLVVKYLRSLYFIFLALHLKTGSYPFRTLNK